ncbi:MAG: selenium cofactor biosynthesis protein YqeC [Halobacteriaceae archaeon]
MELVRALAAEGVVCTVGAGGKKTTLYRLAERIDRAVVTATVRIPVFDDRVADVVVTDDPASAIESATAWPLGVVPEREREDRYRGYDPSVVDEIADAADAILVKADGARMRQFKAPSDREPQIPSSADTVLPIASARVVGEALTDDHVHRVDRVSALTGRDPGDELSATDVATVLASPAGGQKGVPGGATVVPVVNMVDDEALAATAREIAVRIHQKANVPRVVLTEMTGDDPVVDVV